MMRVLALLLLGITAHAAEVAQFRAADFGPTWLSTSGAYSLRPVHSETTGWMSAKVCGAGVSFDTADAVASPLEFGQSVTSSVSRAFIVASCTKPRSLATLLDAPAGASLSPRLFEWDAPLFASETSLGSVEISVDGVPDAPIPMGSAPHLVEIAFPEPVAASSIFIGGSPATPVWNRMWSGLVYEAVFCFGKVGGTDIEALRAYLSLRWALGVHYLTPPDIPARLRSLGVKFGSLYASTLIVR